MSLDGPFPPDQLLVRVSAALRAEVAPAVQGEYPRAQAYMAASVLERVANEVRLGPSHAEADAAAVRALADDLAVIFGGDDPWRDLVADLRRAPTLAALSALVVALHRRSPQQVTADRALDRVRRTLRDRLSRRLELAS